MFQHEVNTVLQEAIARGHAVTISRGGQPFLAEPYAVREQDGVKTLAYFNADSGRFDVVSLFVITEVTNLGKSLDVLRPSHEVTED